MNLEVTINNQRHQCGMSCHKISDVLEDACLNGPQVSNSRWHVYECES